MERITPTEILKDAIMEVLKEFEKETGIYVERIEVIREHSFGGMSIPVFLNILGKR